MLRWVWLCVVVGVVVCCGGCGCVLTCCGGVLKSVNVLVLMKLVW